MLILLAAEHLILHLGWVLDEADLPCSMCPSQVDLWENTIFFWDFEIYKVMAELEWLIF